MQTMQKMSRRQVLEQMQIELTAARILTFAAEARRHGARLVEDVDQGIVRLVDIPNGWHVRKVTLAEVVVLLTRQRDSGAPLTTEELETLLWRGIYTTPSRARQTL
ncbi:MAG TPA: hypothetical protein VF510_25775 [Ktedonobacterales bacterium]